MRHGVGIIGIGFGQHVHVEAFRRDDRCKVVAIAASTHERARRVADRAGIEHAYGDWRALIADQSVRIVSMAVPPALQPDMAEEVVRRRKTLFCEKPLGLDVARVANLARAAAGADIAHMINFEFPELETWQQLYRLLRNEVLGELRHVIVAWHVEQYAPGKGRDSWKNRPRDGGGPINGMASHTLHYLEWCFGPIARLAASIHPGTVDGPGEERLFAMTLEFASGLPASVSISCNSFMGNGHRIEVYGAEGAAVLDNPCRDYMRGFSLRSATREHPEWRHVSREPSANTDEDGRIAPVASMVGKLLDWVDTGRPQSPSLAEGYRVQHLIGCARAAACSGAWVTT